MSKHHHLRDLPSVKLGVHRPTPEFRRFAIEQIAEPLGILRGYKRDDKERAALSIISTLLLAGQRSKTVADSRDEKKAGLRIPIWDALVKGRYAKRCTGSETSGKVTRYYATSKLLNLFADWTLNETVEQHYNKGSAVDPDRFNLIVVKPSKRERHEVTGKRLTSAERWERLKPIPTEFSEWVDTDEDILNYINEQNFKHGWSVTITDDRGRKVAIHPGVTLQQQHVGQFGSWSRLYTHGEWGAQNLPKMTRRTMRIDGDKTASLDFKCSILRLLYHCVGIDPDVRDLYQPDKIFPQVWETATDPFALKAARDIAKKLTIISINSVISCRTLRSC